MAEWSKVLSIFQAVIASLYLPGKIRKLGRYFGTISNSGNGIASKLYIMEILDPTPRMSFLFLVVARGRREREIENSVLSTILPKESTLGPPFSI